MMMQPGAGGVAPSALGQQPAQQYGQQPAQPYMMMPPPTAQAPAMWAPQSHVAPPAPQLPQPASADEVRTLWIGDLQYWMEENYLYNIFLHTGEVVSVKVIRNKQTCQSEGYGFIEFNSRAAAERVLQAFNGTPMPNGAQNFRLNWASTGEKRSDDTPDYTIFVGDLAADVTDYVLQETFRARYPSCKSAKVVIDRLTGRTKGYGFVKFGDESEQMRAMTEMNGVLCSTRPMRIGPAANKNAGGSQQYSNASYQNSQGAKNDSDPNNTTIFVGNLDGNVTDDHLRQVFSKYGELVHVKIPMGKRCGFVQFADRSCAEEALRVLNGSQLGAQNIRLSWGRSPSNKQPQADPSQWNGGGGYYGYAPTPDSYGYAQVSQDPNLYYGSYPAAGYGNYQQPQQQQQQQQIGPKDPQMLIANFCGLAQRLGSFYNLLLTASFSIRRACSMDIISQLQGQVNTIASLTFNTFGTLQRDSPPVRLSPNYPEPPANPTEDAADFAQQPKLMGAALVKAAKQFDALVAALPLADGGEEGQLKRIAELQAENDAVGQELQRQLEAAEKELREVRELFGQSVENCLNLKKPD
ncbi:hypothetical protein TB2_005077 [Malus domestica]